MKTYLSAALLVCLYRTCLGEATYFECFKDRCERGKQYCVPARERCFHCEDMKEHCGTSIMPRDCDSYCIGLNMTNIESRLNSVLDEKNVLQEQIHSLQRSLENSTHDLALMKEEKTDQAQNKTQMPSTDLKHDNTQYEERCKHIQAKYEDSVADKQILITVTALAIGLAVLLVVLVAILERHRCIPFHRTNDRDYIGKESTASEDIKQQTCRLMIEATEDNSGDTSRTSSEDSVSITNTDTATDVTNSYPEEAVADGSTQSEDRPGDENCLNKDIPAGLKGIAPTRNDFSEKLIG